MSDYEEFNFDKWLQEKINYLLSLQEKSKKIMRKS